MVYAQALENFKRGKHLSSGGKIYMLSFRGMFDITVPATPVHVYMTLALRNAVDWTIV